MYSHLKKGVKNMNKISFELLDIINYLGISPGELEDLLKRKKRI